MADKSEKSKSTMTVINPYAITEVPEIDTELNVKINTAVDKILSSDIRIDVEPETISALRDYVMAEVALVKVFKKIVAGEADGSDERIFRACLNAKSHLRDEIWGHVKGVKKKEDFSDAVNEILVDQKIIPRVTDEGDKDKD